MAEARVASVLDELRRRGKRLTNARRVLIQQLAGSRQHLSVDELTDLVQRSNAEIHRATVYRTLETLSELGIVDHSHLGHGPAMYHLRDDVHHHLLCETCGALIEAPASLFKSVERRVNDEYGFVMRPRHFAVVGRCRSCAADD